MSDSSHNEYQINYTRFSKLIFIKIRNCIKFEQSLKC